MLKSKKKSVVAARRMCAWVFWPLAECAMVTRDDDVPPPPAVSLSGMSAELADDDGELLSGNALDHGKCLLPWCIVGLTAALGLNGLAACADGGNR